MPGNALITTIDDRGVALLTLNRPDRGNAFNEDMVDAICDEIGFVSSSPNVRVIVITGAGNTFCGGIDLNSIVQAVARSAGEYKDDARRLSHLMQAIYFSPKPTIALVNGPVLGAGVGLVAACDIAIAPDDADFALSQVRVGLIPAVAAPFVIEAIGARQARRYFVSGEHFSAKRAFELGLIHELAPRNQLEQTVGRVIDGLLKSGPFAQHETKDLIHSIAGQPITEKVFKGIASRIARVRTGDEAREGLDAYFDKRLPAWAPTED